jgi:hypothetical protein
MPTHTFRPATSAEIIQDTFLNPTDFWCGIPLDLDADRVADGARRLWGEPGDSALEGEMMWRLRCDDTPLYVSVNGLGPPGVLFSSAWLPEVEEAERMVEAMRRMLKGSEYRRASERVADDGG